MVGQSLEDTAELASDVHSVECKGKEANVERGSGHSEEDVDVDYDEQPERTLAAKSPAQVVPNPASGLRQVKKRSRGGKLQRLNTISIDVFLEIATHLQPLDILHMARTTKAWRTILMSRVSKPIWRAARSSIPELPDCPDDLNEPQYARLMFGNDCYLCGAKNVPWTSFELRKRICKACSKTSLRDTSQIDHALLHEFFEDRNTSALHLLPHSQGAPHKRKGPTWHWFGSDLDAMVKLRLERVQEPDYEKWCKETRSSAKKLLEEAETFLDFQVLWRSKLYAHYDETGRRRDEKKRKRKAEIIHRFEQLGYDPRDICCPNHVDQVNVAQPLTEKAWLKLRPTLEELIIQKRERRLQAEDDVRKDQREDELKALYTSLQEDPTSFSKEEAADFRPTPEHLRLADFYRLPSIVPLWKGSHRVTSSDWPSRGVILEEAKSLWRTVQNDLLTLLLEDMNKPFPGPSEEAVTTEWVRKLRMGASGPARNYEAFSYALRKGITLCNTPLRSSFSRGVEGHSTSMDLLINPTTVFACSKCHEPLLWPHLLLHDHPTDSCYSRKARESSPFGPLTAWSPDFVYTSVLIRKLMADLAFARRLKNLTLPWTRYELQDYRFEPKCCTPHGFLVPYAWLLTWSKCLTHCLDSYHAECMTAAARTLQASDEFQNFSLSAKHAVDSAVKNSHRFRDHNFESKKLECVIHIHVGGPSADRSL